MHMPLPIPIPIPITTEMGMGGLFMVLITQRFAIVDCLDEFVTVAQSIRNVCLQFTRFRSRSMAKRATAAWINSWNEKTIDWVWVCVCGWVGVCLFPMAASSNPSCQLLS